MISGSTNENSIPKFANLAGRVCQRSMAIANSVPNGTAINIVISDSFRLCTIAWRNAGSWNNESVGSCHHHRNENPARCCGIARALNENAIAMNTGTIDHAM